MWTRLETHINEPILNRGFYVGLFHCIFLNGGIAKVVEKIKAFIFDLDGTVYLGDDLIEGAQETLKWVRSKDAQVRFVTNNPRYSRDFYANKLNNLGIHASIEEIVTSANVTASYLKNEAAYGTVFPIGEEQLETELKDAGVPLTEEDPDTVVVSFDTALDYEKLMIAYHALRKGAHFLATNPDTVCPTPEGGLIDAGAIIAALEASTDRKIEGVIGKPSSLLAKMILKDLELEADQCVVVGDRLNTDIKLAKQAGMKGVWINTHEEELPEDIVYKPDYAIQSIKELPNVCTENKKVNKSF